MINQHDIYDIVKNIIEDKSLFPESKIFIVNIKVSKDNLIQVFLDDMNGISIDACAKISKSIEKSLSRDTEDFELQVSSPGIDKPFVVMQQYQKHIDKEITVKMKDGKIHNGMLISVNDDEIILKSMIDDKRTTEVTEIHINFNQIKETRSIITF
jgi:ribosome maturation factor RimP